MQYTRSTRRLVIWILGALATVTPFAIDLYLPAFSEIADEFGTTPAHISFSVASYFIGMALGQLLYGPLLDRFGRTPPLYCGLAVFTAASIACMTTGGPDTLIAFRFIQALGGSVAWVAAVAMVRDFFPVEESARVFSLLILIIGVSPLLAPTIGGFIVTAWGWKAVFIALAGIAAFVGALVFFYLPRAYQPDPTVSLKPGPMISTFLSILKEPQFYTFSFAGAFSFSSLFIYVAGSPVIFMENFGVSPQVYGGIFALLSVGFIGGSQYNIILTRKFRSDQIFRVALTCQVIASIIFLLLIWNNWIGLYPTIVMFFICLTCIGFTNPNASALSIAPFTRNVGSASALLGFNQIGISALASAGVGLFNAQDTLPVAGLMAATSLVSFLILRFGLTRLGGRLITGSAGPGAVVH